MENLVAVYRVISTNKVGQPPVKKYGHVWIKSQGQAIPLVKKALTEGETLSEIWVCKWKEVPSKYKLVFGITTPENASPNLDMAASLRDMHLKKRGKGRGKYTYTIPEKNKQEKKEETEKPHVKLKNEPKAFKYFTVKEAR